MLACLNAATSLLVLTSRVGVGGASVVVFEAGRLGLHPECDGESSDDEHGDDRNTHQRERRDLILDQRLWSGEGRCRHYMREQQYSQLNQFMSML